MSNSLSSTQLGADADGQLTILGAAYGLSPVTDTVRSLVDLISSPQTLSVQASNTVFGGDPWKGVEKTLTVVYCYDDGPAVVASVLEGQTITITQPSTADGVDRFEVAPRVGDPTTMPLLVLGSTYGLTDVTTTVQDLVTPGQTLSFTANDATLGSGTVAGPKSCVVVYTFNGEPVTLVVQQDNLCAVTQQPFNAIAVDTLGGVPFVLDNVGNVWQGGDQGWTKVGFLNNICAFSFGAAKDIWSVLVTNLLYISQSFGDQGLWTKGLATQVSAGSDGEVWACTPGGTVLRWNSATSDWVQQPAKLNQVAVANADLQWGLDPGNNIQNRTLESQVWNIVAAGPAGAPINSIAASEDGNLFAVTVDGALYLFTGDDDPWMQVGDASLKLQSVSIRNIASAWAITTDGTAMFLGEPEAAMNVDVPFNSNLQWDAESVFDESKSTHLYIVNRAAQLAASCTNATIGNWIRTQTQPMAVPPAAGTFRSAMCQGLLDADFKSPYNNPNALGQATYKSHFYDARTGKNYLGETVPTALSNGAGYLRASISAMRQSTPDLQQGGYLLGLALHYLTDLTQPMHAGNYTYLSSYPWGYHTDFEAYMLKQQAKLSPQPTVTGFQPGGAPSPEALYISTSTASRSKYFGTVLGAINIWFWKFRASKWQKTLQPIMPSMLNDAVAQTAQLIYLWATMVNASSDAKTVGEVNEAVVSK